MFREKFRNSGLHKGRKNIEERISEVKINLFFLVLMYLSDNFLLNNTTNNIFNYVSIYYILIYACVFLYMGFPGGSAVRNLPANSGDAGSIPGSGRSPGEGNGKLLQYSCLENSMDREAWQATVHGVSKSQTRLSD